MDFLVISRSLKIKISIIIFGDFVKSIEINYLTSSGYEALYPQTSSDLVMYNSQTLTQVISQQNSEIEGLQGQVESIEIGKNMPNIKEYHFGAGNIVENVEIPIFPQGEIFPFGIYRMSVIINNLTLFGNNNSFEFSCYGSYIVLFSCNKNVSLSCDSFMSNMSIKPGVGVIDTSNNIDLVFAPIDYTLNYGVSGTSIPVNIVGAGYSLTYPLFFTTSGNPSANKSLSYSSLDIRIYYYD